MQVLSLALVGLTMISCQGISASKAANMPVLSGLPLLTVKSVSQTQSGYYANLIDTDNMSYHVNANRADLKPFVKLAVGDRAKIDGDYAGENPVVITAFHIYKIR